MKRFEITVDVEDVYDLKNVLDWAASSNGPSDELVEGMEPGTIMDFEAMFMIKRVA